MSINANSFGHMTKIATMPIYGKTPFKIFFSRNRNSMIFRFDMHSVSKVLSCLHVSIFTFSKQAFNES